MTGVQLAHKMMAIKPDLPVILCTGFNETITEEKALAMGIDKFVMKPIVRDDLANTIRTVLNTPKASRSRVSWSRGPGFDITPEEFES